MSELISGYQPSPAELSLPPTSRVREFGLTSRRKQVLKLVAKGLPDSEIASQIGTPDTTVKKARESLRRFFDAESTTEAVLMAVERGVLDLDKLTEGLDLTRIGLLTPREREILLAMENNGNKKKERKELAYELSLSPATIKDVQSRINIKLGTNGCLQTRLLVMRATRDGLWPQVQPTPGNP